MMLPGKYFPFVLCWLKKIRECISLDKFVIKGGTPLRGEVNISGAKNAVVAIIPAVILSDGV